MVPDLRSSFLTTWAIRSDVRSSLSLSTARPERDGVGVPPATWIGGEA